MVFPPSSGCVDWFMCDSDSSIGISKSSGSSWMYFAIGSRVACTPPMHTSPSRIVGSSLCCYEWIAFVEMWAWFVHCWISPWATWNHVSNIGFPWHPLSHSLSTSKLTPYWLFPWLAQVVALICTLLHHIPCNVGVVHVVFSKGQRQGCVTLPSSSWAVHVLSYNPRTML